MAGRTCRGEVMSTRHDGSGEEVASSGPRDGRFGSDSEGDVGYGGGDSGGDHGVRGFSGSGWRLLEGGEGDLNRCSGSLDDEFGDKG